MSFCSDATASSWVEFPNDPKLVQEETDFDVNDKSKSENARTRC